MMVVGESKLWRTQNKRQGSSVVHRFIPTQSTKGLRHLLLHKLYKAWKQSRRTSDKLQVCACLLFIEVGSRLWHPPPPPPAVCPAQTTAFSELPRAAAACRRPSPCSPHPSPARAACACPRLASSHQPPPPAARSRTRRTAARTSGSGARPPCRTRSSPNSR